MLRRKGKNTQFLNKSYRPIHLFSLLFIIVALPLIYLIVHLTGGIKYVYSHSMYIPILIAGIVFGTWPGLVVGLIAGILLGPLMPIDTITNEPQLAINWLYRLLIFTSIGGLSGYAANILRHRAHKIDELMSSHPETKISNTNFLQKADSCLSDKKQTIVTVIINNYNNIVDVLGHDVYYCLVRTIYDDIVKAFPTNTLVIQADSNKLWIIKEYVDLKQDSEQILEIINKPKVISSIPLYVDFSIGASSIERGTDCKKLSSFRASDESARYAQINNLPYIVYNDKTMKKRNEYELLANFENALKNNETYLVYQPKIDINTFKPVGLEALIRWKHPSQGMIVPDRFIPLVEETRLIHLLTDWVLKKALLKVKELHKKNINTKISINVSAKNLYDPMFFERTIAIIQESKVPPQYIELEITESVLMVDPEESKKMLEKFVKKGLTIALDDFGKGYSSLAYLSQFPIHTIKIDQIFMRQITTNPTVKQIVRSTIDLSKKLGYMVVAEGVEELEEVNVLKELECDIAQGYYFAKPMEEAAVNEWLSNYSD